MIKKIIALVAVACFTSFIGVLTPNTSAQSFQSSPSTIKSNLVCMVNDKFMGRQQIPVEVGGKTYYGCCQGCVKTLQYERGARIAIDPLSGKEVDKTEAFIALKPDRSGKVNYFESEDNYQKFSQN